MGTRAAILTNPNGDGFTLNGSSWWVLDGFSITNVHRAIILDYSTNIILSNLDVHHTKNAAIKFRNNSTDNLLTNSSISYTGLVAPENGEAVYVGASMSLWLENKPDMSNRNRIVNNSFGPYVSSECVDIKEGNANILVENNFINGHGMDDKNYSQTWISVKGTECTISNNRGVSSVLDGFTV